MRKQKSEMMRALRARMKEAGLIRACWWLKPEEKADVDDYIKQEIEPARNKNSAA
jgi:hypothetical protein